MEACVAGIWKGKERGFWARGKREGRAPLAFLPRLPFQTPATQAIEMVITTNCDYWLKNDI